MSFNIPRRFVSRCTEWMRTRYDHSRGKFTELLSAVDGPNNVRRVTAVLPSYTCVRVQRTQGPLAVTVHFDATAVPWKLQQRNNRLAISILVCRRRISLPGPKTIYRETRSVFSANVLLAELHIQLSIFQQFYGSRSG